MLRKLIVVIISTGMMTLSLIGPVIGEEVRFYESTTMNKQDVTVEKAGGIVADKGTLSSQYLLRSKKESSTSNEVRDFNLLNDTDKMSQFKISEDGTGEQK